MILPVTFTTRLRKKGEITIPAELIRELDLTPGVALEITIQQKGETGS